MSEIREAVVVLCKCGKVHKTYLTEVVGRFECKDKTFEAYLTKDDEKAMVSISKNRTKDSLKIVTKINTIKATNQSSTLEIELLTGRTHQIRAHLAFLGHAIIGDGKYGKNVDNKKFKQTRQKLACIKLSFDDVCVNELSKQCFTKLPRWANE